MNAWNALWVSGYVEGSIFLPGFEYPATPGASPDGLPVIRFPRDEIVNARYEIELNVKIQAQWKYIDRLFLFTARKFFFGDASLDDHSSWNAAPLTMAVQLGGGCRLPSIPSYVTRTPSSGILAARQVLLSGFTGTEFLCVGVGREHGVGQQAAALCERRAAHQVIPSVTKTNIGRKTAEHPDQGIRILSIPANLVFRT